MPATYREQLFDIFRNDEAEFYVVAHLSKISPRRLRAWMRGDVSLSIDDEYPQLLGVLYERGITNLPHGRPENR